MAPNFQNEPKRPAFCMPLVSRSHLLSAKGRGIINLNPPVLPGGAGGSQIVSRLKTVCIPKVSHLGLQRFPICATINVLHSIGRTKCRHRVPYGDSLLCDRTQYTPC